jgi:hypothetical protein
MGNVPAKEARLRAGTAKEESRRSGRGSDISIASGGGGGGGPSSRSSTHRKHSAGSKKDGSPPLVADSSEMVDGGYLVPQGVYKGPQDYKLKVVRQLMIERRLAPFFKGLPDYEDFWTDRQLLAAVRGLPIPVVEDLMVDNPSSTITTNDMNGESMNNAKNPCKEDSSNDFEGNSKGESNGKLSYEGRDIGSSEQPSPRLWGFPSGNNGQTKTTTDDVENDVNKDQMLEVNGKAKGKEAVDRYVDEPLVAFVEPLCSSLPDRLEKFPTKLSSLTPDNHSDTSADNRSTFSDQNTRNRSSSMASSTSADKHSGEEPSGEVRLQEPIFKPESPKAPSLKQILEMKADSAHLEFAPPAANPVKSSIRLRSNTSSRYSPGTAVQSSSPPLEVLCYRGALECPICFLFYPKFTNTTRCCAQPICSECFVQIKRSDPHPPYHNEPGVSAEDEQTLVSEPACCPYCAMPEFGVVYIPSPYRAGISPPTKSHLSPLSLFSHHSTPMSTASSSSSLASGLNPRRRGSLPPNAPEVVTTDQIRPDWSVKLNKARLHLARKSAAATALHASAFLLDNGASGSAGTSSSSLAPIPRRERLKKKANRLRGFSNPSLTPSSSGSSSNASPSTSRRHTTTGAPQFVFLSSSRRTEVDTRSRLRELEDTMIVEAIRRSLADESSSQGSSKKNSGEVSARESSTARTAM